MKKTTLLIASVTLMASSCVYVTREVVRDNDVAASTQAPVAEQEYSSNEPIPDEQIQAPPSVAATDVFVEPLSPYGSWVMSARYGNVWVPHRTVVGANWRPYTYGHWELTEYGWTWVSDFAWGWAPFHYGRWGWDSAYGWVWAPDTVWGPAWVHWRTGDAYVGWAPIAPGIGFGVAYEVAPGAWVFVENGYFVDNRIYGYIIYGAMVTYCLSHTTYYDHVWHHHGHRHYYGPDVNYVRRHSHRTVPYRRASSLDRPDRPVYRPPSYANRNHTGDGTGGGHGSNARDSRGRSGANQHGNDSGSSAAHTGNGGAGGHGSSAAHTGNGGAGGHGAGGQADTGRDSGNGHGVGAANAGNGHGSARDDNNPGSGRTGHDGQAGTPSGPGNSPAASGRLGDKDDFVDHSRGPHFVPDSTRTDDGRGSGYNDDNAQNQGGRGGKDDTVERNHGPSFWPQGNSRNDGTANAHDGNSGTSDDTPRSNQQGKPEHTSPEGGIHFRGEPRVPQHTPPPDMPGDPEPIRPERQQRVAPQRAPDSRQPSRYEPSAPAAPRNPSPSPSRKTSPAPSPAPSRYQPAPTPRQSPAPSRYRPAAPSPRQSPAPAPSKKKEEKKRDKDKDKDNGRSSGRSRIR